MSGDAYVVLRTSTLAWLLERHRVAGEPVEVPEEVARDLREAVVSGRVPAPDPEQRLRALGPLLNPEQQVTLLAEDASLRLPRGDAGEFWRVVVKVVHAMNVNEAEAVLRVIGASDEH